MHKCLISRQNRPHIKGNIWTRERDCYSRPNIIIHCSLADTNAVANVSKKFDMKGSQYLTYDFVFSRPFDVNSAVELEGSRPYKRQVMDELA